MNRLVCCLFSLLLGCSAPEQPLRIGISPWPPTEVARLAEQLGYFGEAKVSIVEFHSPAEAGHAYLTGGLDAVALTMDYVQQHEMYGDEHRAFLVIDESFGADAVVSRHPIERLDEIAGRRIGLEPGPLGAHVLRRLLEKAGLDRQDIDMVFLEMPEQREAFFAGQVDVLVTYEPLLTELRKAGAQEVFSSREIPGEIVDVFVARRKQIAARQAEFRAFSTAWFRALRQLREDPLRCAAVVAPRLGMTASEFVDALAGAKLPSLRDNRVMLGASNDAFRARVGRFLSVREGAGEANAETRLESFFTADALPNEPKIRQTFGKTRN